MAIYSEIILGRFILENYVITRPMSLEERGRLLIWLYEWWDCPDRATADFWELVLCEQIPNRCLTEFLIAAKSDRGKETELLCLFELICLFSINPHLTMIKGYFQSLDFNFKLQSIKDQAEATSVQIGKDTLAGILISHYGIVAGHPRYNFAVAMIQLLGYQDYMKISTITKEFLFERLLNATCENPEHSPCLDFTLSYFSNVLKPAQ